MNIDCLLGVLASAQCDDLIGYILRLCDRARVMNSTVSNTKLGDHSYLYLFIYLFTYAQIPPLTNSILMRNSHIQNLNPALPLGLPPNKIRKHLERAGLHKPNDLPL